MSVDQASSLDPDLAAPLAQIPPENGPGLAAMDHAPELTAQPSLPAVQGEELAKIPDAAEPKPEATQPLLAELGKETDQAASAGPGSPAAQAGLNWFFERRPGAGEASDSTVEAGFPPSEGESGLLNAPSASQKAYEASIPRPRPLWQRRALGAWTAAGLTGMIAAGWALPYTGSVWLALPGSVLLVESFGYVYHRFFQHVGFMTRIDQHLPLPGTRWFAGILERNQMFHWIHHMVIYPLGKDYRQAGGYKSAETAPEIKFWLLKPLKVPLEALMGLGLSWLVPGLLALGLAVLTMGLNPASLAFMGGIALYSVMISYTHEAFHLIEHPLINNRPLRPLHAFFRWLDKIHVFHHWDQYVNFTILFPLMDILFGTYRSPSGHLAGGVTVSDFINWRYLLNEARPATRAAVISHAKHHAPSIRKIEQLTQALGDRVLRHPEDTEAAQLRRRSFDLLKTINRR